MPHCAGDLDKMRAARNGLSHFPLVSAESVTCAEQIAHSLENGRM